MITVLAESGVTSGITQGLSDFSDVMTSVVGIITGNAVLMTIFCGGLLAVGARVFKRIKRAVK